MSTPATKLLAQLDQLRLGQPFHRDKLSAKNWHIGVKGLGRLSWPLNPIQVNALLEKAHQAPFGKGRKTLVDTSVRNTHEIDADQLELDNANFQRALKRLLKRIGEALAIEQQIHAEPYKLLIYEPGGFFAAHQDSEKLPGMFGTLLIGLPSPHEGGTIELHPGDGDPVHVDFSTKGASNFPALAFLADRQHEILPVTEGYRVVLVFNLVYASAKPAPVVTPEALVDQLAETLRDLPGDKVPMVFALGHQYTDSNFSTEQLKGHDRMRVALMRRAAAAVGLAFRVGLIHDRKVSEWYNGHQYGHSYDYRYGRGSAEHLPEPKRFADVETGEIIDEELGIEHWLPEDGFDLGGISLKPQDIYSASSYGSEEPIEWSVEGYQGNWGMTADYEYRYAGIVLWHPARTPQLIGKLPLEGQIAWAVWRLESLASAQPASAKTSDEGEELPMIVALFEQLHERLSGRNHRPENFDALVRGLALLGNQPGIEAKSLGQRWVELLAKHFQAIDVETWRLFIATFGKKLTNKTFAGAVFAADDADNSYRYRAREDFMSAFVQLIEQLATGKNKRCRSIGLAQFADVPVYLPRFYPGGQIPNKVIESLIRIDAVFGQSEAWRARVVDAVLVGANDVEQRQQKLWPLIQSIKDVSPLGELLHAHLVADLKRRVANEPQPYPDWARPVPEQMLTEKRGYPKVVAFLRDPEAEVLRVQAVQDMRHQLEGYLSRFTLDIEMTTEKTRPAYTLVLTKTDRSYREALEAWRGDVAWLEAAQVTR